MNHLASHIQSHVFFSHHADVVDICRPLTNLGIKGFIFTRHYNDGTFVDLGTHLAWGNYFFDHYFKGLYSKADLQEDMFRVNGPCLSVLSKDNQVWQDGAHHFNIGNGITMHKEYDSCCEIYCFYGDCRNSLINQFYVANIDILEKFIQYFKDQAGPIIQHGSYNRLVSPKKYINNMFASSNENVNLFLNEINDEGAKGKLLLSARELLCVQKCAQGKTSQEIGKELFLSPRTIEKHLGNAKKKLSCRTLCELVYLVSKIYSL